MQLDLMQVDLLISVYLLRRKRPEDTLIHIGLRVGLMLDLRSTGS